MSNLIPWRGVKDLEGLKKEMDDLFERFSDWRPSLRLRDKGDWIPSVDLTETAKEIIVRAEVPGMEKEDIDVSLESKTLTIRGEKKTEHEENEENVHRVERRYGSFMRSIELPAEVNPDKVNATYKGGVLRLKLPKVKSQSAKKIEVKGS
ncbi:Hsp20/alpha crystallin family protein [Thermodesulfobacteriota bacterium]